jgi:4-amino-4-deoxy-L-arabinose transferase-like glycosyltransferase
LSLVGLSLLGAILFTYRLGGRPLFGWDEAIYATIARNMVGGGGVLIGVFSWPGYYDSAGVFLEKPPLQIWLEAFSIWILGPTEFAVRLPSALSAASLGVAVYWLGRRSFDWYVGFASAIVLYTLPPLLHRTHGGRFGSTDAMLVFFGTLFLWGTWQAIQEQNRRMLFASAIAAGLAIMTKGPAAGLYAFLALPLIFPVLREFDSRTVLIGVGLTLVIALPWHLYAWSMYPVEFVQQYVLEQTLHRATGRFGDSFPGGIFPFMRFPYFTYFPRYFLVYTYAIVPAVGIPLLGVVYRPIRDDFWSVDLFFIWWLLFPLVFYSVFGNHQWYILPIVVPVAVLLGRISARVFQALFSSQRLTAVQSHSETVYAVGGAIILVAALVLMGWPSMHGSDWSSEQKNIAAECLNKGSDHVYVTLRDESHVAFPLEFYMQGVDSVTVTDDIESKFKCSRRG